MTGSSKNLSIHKIAHPEVTRIVLPASKSIANRALMIRAFAGNGELENLSNARDTQTMDRLLKEDNTIWDVLDAGTTMRFLTAFAAMRGEGKILTGTKRMKERPIAILVNALRELGAQIAYTEKEGFPPLSVNRIQNQLTDRLTIRGDISSQYISALLMISPVLPDGLTLELTGRVGSRPYINMTLKVMQHFGISAEWLDENTLRVSSQEYRPATYRIEPDWSAASYWYSVVAMNPGQQILLVDLVDDSIQGDRKMADLMHPLGVNTQFLPEGALLSTCEKQDEVTFDFADCPDLAQTIATICAWSGTICRMTGLESLRIKETDRIAALQTELGKIGAQLLETPGEWELRPQHPRPEKKKITFATYHDHRMAMALAPLAAGYNVTMEDPDVVNKSYPHFWEDMQRAGYEIS